MYILLIFPDRTGRKFRRGGVYVGDVFRNDVSNSNSNFVRMLTTTLMQNAQGQAWSGRDGVPPRMTPPMKYTRKHSDVKLKGRMSIGRIKAVFRESRSVRQSCNPRSK